ncbi:MAG: ABC transporter ATP-binding protein [Phycisphaerales bacterium JB039]
MSRDIRIRGLVKDFGESRAVDAVDVDIAPGELFFLLGPSGCGKTTLLRMIAGFIDPTAGSIAIGGRDVTRQPANKRNTAMVFQSYALWPHMTVQGNVGFGLQVRRAPGAERARRIAEALKTVQMTGYEQRKPGQLSGGQQQRVALARALAPRPDVLLLDEPLSNLDARLRLELRAEIRRICKQAGITTVYVTHDQKEALSMADRIAVMREGRIEQIGSPQDLYRRPRSRFVAEFMGETNLLEATLGPGPEGLIEVKTAAGTLLARPAAGAPREGPALCSIRPEAIRLGAPDGQLRGRRVSETYLGELAQHEIEVAGAVRLRVAEINPADAGAEGEVGLRIDPADVALIPRDGGTGREADRTDADHTRPAGRPRNLPATGGE